MVRVLNNYYYFTSSRLITTIYKEHVVNRWFEVARSVNDLSWKTLLNFKWLILASTIFMVLEVHFTRIVIQLFSKKIDVLVTASTFAHLYELLPFITHFWERFWRKCMSKKASIMGTRSATR